MCDLPHPPLGDSALLMRRAGRVVEVDEPPAPDTQFRRARAALGLADASRRTHSGAAAEPTVRRVAFESPSDTAAAHGSPAVMRTPPALKEGYTPLTQEYLRVSVRLRLGLPVDNEAHPCRAVDDLFHLATCTQGAANTQGVT